MTGTVLPQHLVALAEANRVRSARAGLKRQVAAGELSVRDVLLDHRGTVRSMPVGELVRAQYGWGRGKTYRFLVGLGLSTEKRIGSFTDRQVRLVVTGLECGKSMRGKHGK